MAARLEPMNASQHHSKVKVTLDLGARTFVAGQDITGQITVETRADTGLGVSVIQVELVAVQELTSRDHSASSAFLQSRRMFQGPGLPPSNAVEALPKPGDPIQLPQGYWPARRGTTRFLFKFPIPLSAPSSISFGSGVAKVTYRLKATVGVVWKGEKKLVTDLRDVDVVECSLPEAAPTGTVVVGEGGKIWMQGRLVGGVGVAGHPSCVELSVKNHTAKKASGLTLSLIRQLHLPSGGKSTPFQLSDNLVNVPFKGPEYTVVPGGEGVANLVFDIPQKARGVRGGPRENLESEDPSTRLTDPLFEVRCFVEVKLNLGIGSKDLILELPINILHPAAVPELPPAPVPNPADPYASPIPYPLEPPRLPFVGMDTHSGQSSPLYPAAGYSPGGHIPVLPVMSPVPNYVPHPSMSPHPQWPNEYFAPGQAYYYIPPPEVMPIAPVPARPSSADPYVMPPMPIALNNIPPPLGVTRTTSTPVSVHHTGVSGLPRPLPQPAHHNAAPIPPPRQEYGLPPMPMPMPVTAMDEPATPQKQDPNSSVPKWVLGQESSPKETAPTGGPQPETEEGKGERASRIAQNLHASRRDRSASPTSRRFFSPRASRAIRPPPLVMPPQQTVAQMVTELPVLSPRPVLSPKRSAAKLQDGRGTMRSDNVENLERIVAAGESADLQPLSLPVTGPGGFPDLTAPGAEKTLPGPPVPSGKAPPSTGVPRATEIFGGGAGLSTPTVAHDVPRGATLTVPKRSSGFVRPVGGLDALEERLLADVGTTKVQARVAEAESESVLRTLKLGGVAEENEDYTVEELLKLSGGIERALDKRRLSREAPQRERERERERRPSNAGVDLTAVRPHGSDVPIVSSAGLPPLTASQERKIREQEDPARKAEEKKREEEAAALRRQAKGRIANWLGHVSAEPVPEPVVEAVETVKAHRRDTAEVDRTRKTSQPKAAEIRDLRNLGVEKEDGERKRGFSADARIRKDDAALTPPKSSDEAQRTRRISLPPATDVYDNPWASEETKRARPVSVVQPRPQPAVGATATPNPLKSTPAPALLDMPKPKSYDVRSARGGRGGKVAAVAAIWAAAAGDASAPEPAKAPLSPGLKAPKKLDLPSPKTTDVLSPRSPGVSPKPFDFPVVSPKRTPGPLPKVEKPVLPKSATSPMLSTSPMTRTPAVAPKPAPPPVAPKPAALSAEKRVTSPTSSKPTPAAPLRPDPANKPPASTSTSAAARLIKSASVPAVLSTSTAKPTLSTSASLARPVTLVPIPRSPPANRVSELPEQAKKLPSAAAALRTVQTQDTTPHVAPPPELQFGKARLKELIQKYQDGR